MTKHTDPNLAREAEAAVAADASSMKAERVTIEGAEGRTSNGGKDDFLSQAAAAAAKLNREGRAFLADHEDEVTEATAKLSDSIRKNPLAAVGIAFAIGLVFARLTRG